MTNNMRVRRGFASCDKCWLCSEKVEDIEHVLRECPAADEVWLRILPELHHKSRNMSFRNWLDYGIANRGNGHKPELENSLFALTIWWLWKWRNNAIFTGRFHSIQSKVQWESRSWKGHEEGAVKVNYDGSIDHLTNKLGCGGLIRDERDKWIGDFVNNIGSCTLV